jgi:hypothetical protein
MEVRTATMMKNNGSQIKTMTTNHLSPMMIMIIPPKNQRNKYPTLALNPTYKMEILTA